MEAAIGSVVICTTAEASVRSEESPDRGWARIVPRTGRLRKASMPGRPNIASSGLFFETETGDDVM